MKLTNIQIKNAQPKDKMYRLNDGDNLSLTVNPSGSKRWYLAYSLNNKRKQVSLGEYPLVSLKEARELKLEKKKLVMHNIDPVQAKRQEKLDFEMQHVNTFEAIAREWHEQKRHTWQPRHADNIMKRLEMHLFPILCNKPIVNITPPELLHTLKPIEQQGRHEMAKRMLQTTAQIYRYAIACGKAERNITTDLQGALKPSATTHRAYLEEQQLPDFLRKLNCYDSTYNGNPITKWGFQLLILTFVRTSELRQAQWSEIDFKQKLWRIPAERMKMRKELLVPLSAQSIALFKKIHEVTRNSYSGYVLPSFQNPRKCISENTFLRAIDLMGYKGITTGHGFRTTARHHIKRTWL